MTIKKVAGFILFVFTFITLFSCSDKKEKPPVPLGKMQQLLLDLHLAESYSVGLYPDSLKKKFDKNPDSLAVYYAIVLKHHGMNIEQFKEVMDWYKQHPDMLDSLYIHTLDEANRLQAEEDKRRGPLEKSDSGKKALGTKPGIDTTHVKRQRDSLRQNRRVFHGDSSLNNKSVR